MGGKVRRKELHDTRPQRGKQLLGDRHRPDATVFVSGVVPVFAVAVLVETPILMDPAAAWEQGALVGPAGGY